MISNDYGRVWFMGEQPQYMPRIGVEHIDGLFSFITLYGDYEIMMPLVTDKTKLPEEIHIVYGKCGSPTHYEGENVLIKFKDIENDFWKIPQPVTLEQDKVTRLFIYWTLKGKVELL